jgi:hypothetical protein
MNTAGSSNDAKAARGSGNVEFNGLPATSNGYIVEGFDANDNGQVGGIGIAPGVPASAADATALANQSFQSTFQTNGNPCAGVAPGAPTCPLAVNLNIFPTEN